MLNELSVVQMLQTIKLQDPVELYYNSYDKLHAGDYKNGFKLFEYRWHPSAIATLPEPFVKLTPQPVWRGEPLFGKSITVQMEMGYGDCIQFYRFLPLLKALGAKKVVVLQTKSLHYLLSQMECIDYISNDETQGASVETDYWIGSMSLPYVAMHGPKYIQAMFPITKDHVIGADGYFDAPPSSPIIPLVGVNWGASHRYLHGVKSTTAEKIAEIIGTTEAYSLNPESNGCFKALPTTTWKDNWLETASYMKSMKAVVTIDTGTAHLAGSLGVPCIVLLPEDKYVCWRWKNAKWYNSITTLKNNEWHLAADILRKISK
jgi:hypothetical protein